MFEKEIKFINDLTVSKLKGFGEYISLEQIKSAGIHPAIIKYIEAEIDFLIYEDRQKLLKQSIFDYSGNSIEKHFVAISDEIKKHKKFTQEYIGKLVLHAVSFTINYLTKPNWSIVRFIFDNSNIKSTSEISTILNYIYFYDYLKKIILSYLEKKKLLSLSKSELEELLGKINQVGSETNAIPIIETAVKSISNFVNYHEAKRTSVSLNSVLNFLTDKNFKSFSEILNNKFDVTNLNMLVEPVDLISTIKAEQERKLVQEKIKNEVKEEEKPKHEFIEVQEEKSDEIENEPEILEDEIITEIEEPEKVVEQETPVEAINEFNDDDLPDEDVSQTVDDVVDALEPEEIITEELTTEPEEDENIELKSEDEISEINENNDVELDLFADQEEVESKIEEAIEEPEIKEEENIAEIELSEEETSAESEIKDFTEETRLDEFEEILDIDEKEPLEFEPVFEEEKSENIDDQIAEENNETEAIEEENFDLSEEKENEVHEPDIDDELTEVNLTIKDAPKNSEEDESVKVVVNNTIEPKEIKDEQNPFDELADESEALEKLSEEIEGSKLDLKVPIGSPIAKSSLNFESEKIEEELPEETAKPETVEINSGETKGIVVEEEFTDEHSFAEDKLGNEINSTLHFEEETKEIISEQPNLENVEPEIDIADLLEHKKMTRIIEIIFDYDMEDFTNCIDKVSECKNQDEAEKVLEDVFRQNDVKPKRKEAELFKEILFDYFKRK